MSTQFKSIQFNSMVVFVFSWRYLKAIIALLTTASGLHLERQPKVMLQQVAVIRNCSIADNCFWPPTRYTTKSCAAVGGSLKFSIKMEAYSICLKIQPQLIAAVLNFLFCQRHLLVLVFLTTLSGLRLKRHPKVFLQYITKQNEKSCTEDIHCEASLQLKQLQFGSIF